MAVVRSPDFLRALIRETALATLIHQRRLTPSCGGQAPTAERTVGPARMIAESLTPKPGIREQYLPRADSLRRHVGRSSSQCTACVECSHTTGCPRSALLLAGDLFLSGRARRPLGGRSSALALEAAQVSVIAIS